MMIDNTSRKFNFDELEKYMLFNIYINNDDNINNNCKTNTNCKLDKNKNKFNELFNNKKQETSEQLVKDNNIDKNNKDTNNKDTNNKNTNTLFYPSNSDKLFWCLYIINNGINEYNLNASKYFSIEKEIKINAITYMKNNNHKIKLNKSSVENNLLYEKNITIQSFALLCDMLNLNIRIINTNHYYEFLNNDSQDFTNIIYDNKYGIDLLKHNNNNNDNNNDINNKFLVTNYSKPINSITYYKVDDIYVICNKLKINIKNNKDKNKTKKELYDEIYKILNS
jgi:hypothetical protein